MDPAPASRPEQDGPDASRGGSPARWRRPLERLQHRLHLDRGRPHRRSLLTIGVCFLAGLMITVSAINARGTDLRPERHTELIDLVRSEAARSQALAEQVAALRSEIDELAASTGDDAAVDDLAELDRLAGLEPVAGPGVTVTLTDAPLSVDPPDVDGDLLVVHQQDIQAVVNVLWRGGAEAMTIQGQRVISTTGIKCVGNTVVLHGVPYAPPYVISAIGDSEALESALDRSAYLDVYADYVDAYGLGYEQRVEPELRLAGFNGASTLEWATPAGVD
ncbi:DUF881 domain-containing protein [Desertihabitans brevis]|nr:DUF881 domain-containing protein [Desertihabitans brevis]